MKDNSLKLIKTCIIKRCCTQVFKLCKALKNLANEISEACSII